MKKIVSSILAIASLATAAVAFSGCFEPDHDYYTYKVYELKEERTQEDFDENGNSTARELEYYSDQAAVNGRMNIAEYDPKIVGLEARPDFTYAAVVQNRWVDVEGTLYHGDGTTTVLEKEQRDIVGGEFSYIGDIPLYEHSSKTTFKTTGGSSSLSPKIAVKIGEYDVFVQWHNLEYNLYKYLKCDTTECSFLTYEAPNINGVEKIPSYTEIKIKGTKDGKTVDVEVRINESTAYGPENTRGCVEKFRYLIDGVGYDLEFSNYQYTVLDGYECREWLLVGGGNKRYDSQKTLTAPSKIVVNGKQENVPLNNVEATNISLDIEAQGTCSVGTAYDFIFFYDTDEFIFKMDSVKKLANFQTTNPDITVKTSEDMYASENDLIVYELEIKTTVKNQGTSTQYTRFAFDPKTGLIKEFINKLDDNGT